MYVFCELATCTGNLLGRWDLHHRKFLSFIQFREAFENCNKAWRTLLLYLSLRVNERDSLIDKS